MIQTIQLLLSLAQLCLWVVLIVLFMRLRSMIGRNLRRPIQQPRQFWPVVICHHCGAAQGWNDHPAIAKVEAPLTIGTEYHWQCPGCKAKHNTVSREYQETLLGLYVEGSGPCRKTKI